MKKQNKFTKILALLYVIVNVIFVVQLFKLGTLPTKYNIILTVILLLFVTVILLGIFKSKKKFIKNFYKTLLVIISIALIVANAYMYKYGSFLDIVTDGLKKTEVVSVVVRKDSDYNSLEDVSDLVFGIEDEHEAIVTEAIGDFEKQLGKGIQTTDYETYQSLGSALLNSELEVIIMNEAFRNFIQDEHPDFDDQTKVIAKFEKVVDLVKTDVNVTKDTFTVLISGIDVYGDISNNARSDVNILATVNPKTKQILLTSIPRDYYLPISCQNNNMDKLTHTGIWGVDCTMGTLGNLFGIDVDLYARVNFSSLINVVDAVGGVTVHNDNAFSAQGFDFPYGEVYLDGEKSLAFVRDRYHQVDGDLARGRNQMKVLTAVINKMLSPALITNFNSILGSLEGTFQTNMSSRDINSLVQMQLNDMASWNIEQMQVLGTGASDYSYALGGNYYVMYPDMSTVNPVIEAMNKLYE